MATAKMAKINKFLKPLICLVWLCACESSELDKIPYDESLENVAVEFLISYKLISKNNIAQKEKYAVSQVMNAKGSKNHIVAKECEIDVGDYLIMDDMAYFLRILLKREQEQVLDCLYGYKVGIRESTQGKNANLDSKQSLEIRPVRVLASLHNRSILLKILEQQ